jgi:hypothetical protein
MSNSKYNIAGIEAHSKAFAEGTISKKAATAGLLGLTWSSKTAQYIKAKGAKPMINVTDLSFNKAQYADNSKFHALQRGYVMANSERFGTVGLAGFNMLELFSMDRDAVKAHKLKLCAGNKKPANAAQKKALAAFIKAQRTADNRISTGMQNLRTEVNNMLGVPKVVKPSKTPKAQTAKGKDTQTGGVSTDTHIESGPVTEAKTSPAPRSIQHPVLIELVNKLAAFNVAEQAVIAESQSVQNLLEGLTRTLSDRNK